MAGHANEPQLQGWQKHFNSVTNRGRLNCAYASAAIWGSLLLFFVMKPKKIKEIKN